MNIYFIILIIYAVISNIIAVAMNGGSQRLCFDVYNYAYHTS